MAKRITTRYGAQGIPLQPSHSHSHQYSQVVGQNPMQGYTPYDPQAEIMARFDTLDDKLIAINEFLEKIEEQNVGIQDQLHEFEKIIKILGRVED